ncbi:MAG: peroxiredoxin [Chromatiales bacterium]|jgi:peroxiredoxin Q/BCP|nr:MAG: peroxiredoxin [Chromatiales bacterium]
MSTITVGKAVPNFSLPATGGKAVDLKGLRGSNVVIYFYPKDNTPGCTTESCDFGDLHSKFRRKKTIILGVSRDSLASHEKFKAKFEFPFDLLSDGDETLCRLFDVIREKNMYGKKVMGVVRSTFLIDAMGKLRAEWRKVSVKGHAAEVLAAVEAL